MARAIAVVAIGPRAGGDALQPTDSGSASLPDALFVRSSTHLDSTAAPLQQQQEKEEDFFAGAPSTEEFLPQAQEEKPVAAQAPPPPSGVRNAAQDLASPDFFSTADDFVFGGASEASPAVVSRFFCLLEFFCYFAIC